MLSEYQLKKYANDFLRKNYGFDLTVPLKYNGRLKRSYGRFIYYNNPRKPKCVEINRYFAETNSNEVVIDVLRHELIHYAVFMLGQPCRDGDDYFENELAKHNTVSQNTIKKHEIAPRPYNVNVYECQMPNCKQVYKRKRALKNEGIHHRCQCGGVLINKGKRLVNA